MRSVGWPTPTGTLWPSLPQVPTPVSSFMSLPIIVTRVSAAAVAGGRDFHEARVHRVLDVAAQDAVFDQHVALRGVAFVVDVERAAPVGQRAVVEHGHAARGHALPDAARERARALAVEVAL